MRKSDKKKSILKANLIAEQRYLKSKGLINESFHDEDGTPIGVNSKHEPISEMGADEPEKIPEIPEALKQAVMDFLSQQRVGSAAQANDNKAAFYNWLETMWSPQHLHYGANGNEIRTNNPEFMSKYLDKHQITGKSFVREGGNEPFPVYHDTYGSAINAIDDYVKMRGFELDQEEYSTTYLDAFFKPKPGETKSDSLTLYKDGKPQRKMMNVQIYGMDSGKFELNMYIN